MGAGCEEKLILTTHNPTHNPKLIPVPMKPCSKPALEQGFLLRYPRAWSLEPGANFSFDLWGSYGIIAIANAAINP